MSGRPLYMHPSICLLLPGSEPENSQLAMGAYELASRQVSTLLKEKCYYDQTFVVFVA